MTTPPRNVGLIGMGVIGNGWAVHFLGRGCTVRAYDPDPAAAERLVAYVETARSAVERLGGNLDGWRERATVTSDLESAVAEADFVQESGPEKVEVKAPIIAAIDRAARPDVVIASSSSGLLPSQLCDMAPHQPERILIGHPFNPVYLIPLVEVVPGQRTAPASVAAALAAYTALGKKPVSLRTELPGHLVNRLQAALWREAYSLVERGAATVADIDTAIAYGPGLRWALLGPLANQHLSGGAGGLAHILEHLGPPTQKWMDDLGEPQLNPALAARLIAGVDDALAEHDPGVLVVERDRLLVDLLLAKADSELP